MTTAKSGRLALLVGGGPAPGINGVISAVTIEAIEQGMEVIGFLDGFRGLVDGRTDHFIPLKIDNVKQINLRGGSLPRPPDHFIPLKNHNVKQINPRGGSILRTSRTNPAKPPELLRKVLDVLHKLD